MYEPAPAFPDMSIDRVMLVHSLEATENLEDLMRELMDDLTIVIVTHNMQQASRISEATAFFYMGELVEMSDTETMFTRPRQQRTEDYITGRFG